MQSLVQLLNNYDARRDEEFTGLIRTVYDRVQSQQAYEIEQVNDRLDVLGRELVLDRNRYARSLDDLLSTDPAAAPASLEADPNRAPEE
jgi:hypothetical protein